MRAFGAIVQKEGDMNDAGACAKGVQGWLEQLDAAAVTAEEGKRGLLEAH